MTKKIAILGSTGSIGTQTLEVVDRNPDYFQVEALSAGNSRLEEFVKQIRKYRPKIVSVPTRESANWLVNQLGTESRTLRILSGEEGLIEAAATSDASVVVTAIVGTLGLPPTLAALQSGKDIALANKETMVAAGHIVTQLALRMGRTILPVDSEHSAIFQCMQGQAVDAVEKLILTASGGPFRGYSREEMQEITPSSALAHPNWSMGAKITIDSATLMNKGLEVIEAHWLFGVEYDRIDVVVHPQSIIHSMVQFNDQSVLAQMGVPKMYIPIQYALTYPERPRSQWPTLDLVQLGQLTFEASDKVRFPMLEYAYQAGRLGGTMTAVLNAANESAVELFLDEKIRFLEMESLIYRVMEKHELTHEPSLEEILEADRWARQQVQELAIRL